MARQPFELLYAIVFGFDEFRRPGAPEPDIIGDLAPLLTDTELEKAFEIVSQLTEFTNTEPRRVYARLLARATELKVQAPPKVDEKFRRQRDAIETPEVASLTLDNLERREHPPGWFFSAAIADLAPALDQDRLAQLLDTVESYDIENDPYGHMVDVRSECVITLARFVGPPAYGRLIEVALNLPRDLNGNRAREIVEKSIGAAPGWWPEFGRPLDSPTGLRTLFGSLDPGSRRWFLEEFGRYMWYRNIGGATSPAEAEENGKEIREYREGSLEPAVEWAETSPEVEPVKFPAKYEEYVLKEPEEAPAAADLEHWELPEPDNVEGVASERDEVAEAAEAAEPAAESGDYDPFLIGETPEEGIGPEEPPGVGDGHGSRWEEAAAETNEHELADHDEPPEKDPIRIRVEEEAKQIQAEDRQEASYAQPRKRAEAEPLDQEREKAERMRRAEEEAHLDQEQVVRRASEPPLAPHFPRSPRSRPSIFGGLFDAFGRRGTARPQPERGPRRREDTGAILTIEPTKRPVVNTGFTPETRPNKPIKRGTALATSRRYYFWLEVGTPKPGAIDVKPVSLPTKELPPRARLTVALFAFDGEIAIDPEADVGELEVKPDGSAIVTKTAAEPRLSADSDLLRRRLFFPVITPTRRGRYRLRCNLYYRQVLVQSHIVTVRVTGALTRPASHLVDAVRRAPTPALATECDYTLSHSLTDMTLGRIEAHRLSLMLNDNGDGTHGFRAFGDDGKLQFKQDASFANLELQDFINNARGALRRAAWGTGEQWINQGYRYANGPDLERLRVDLANLARWGWRFYDAIANRLAASGVNDPAAIRVRKQQLNNLIAAPGYIQFASKRSAREVVPVALLYDYGIDDTAEMDRYSLCPDFLAALTEKRPLLETGCFRGQCPSRGEELVVCPSGFWGFRHRIGLPVSIGGHLRDGAFKIPLFGAPELTMAVATDPTFKLRVPHEKAIRALRADLLWNYADTRDKAIQLLREATSHVVYFYCHGGVSDNVPYIEVGQGLDSALTRAFIALKEIFFETVQPLIFINGCHTTALDPETALDLVTGFVENANAAGVIGTEITVFEPLACQFAEPCLRHFLRGETIGEAVRLARLALLQEGNPLGLVYIPFVIASLALAADGR